MKKRHNKILYIVLVIFLLTACGKKGNQDNDKGTDKSFEMLEEVTLKIEDKTIKLPNTLQTVVDIGKLEVSNESYATLDDTIDAKESERIIFSYDEEDKALYVDVVNTTDAPQSIKDCLIERVISQHNNIYIGGINTGNSFEKVKKFYEPKYSLESEKSIGLHVISTGYQKTPFKVNGYEVTAVIVGVSVPMSVYGLVSDEEKEKILDTIDKVEYNFLFD